MALLKTQKISGLVCYTQYMAQKRKTITTPEKNGKAEAEQSHHQKTNSNQKKLTIVVLLVVIAAILVLYLNSTNGQLAGSDKTSFQDSTGTLSFEYPSIYTQLEPRVFKDNVTTIFHRDDSKKLGFELSTQNQPQGKTLDDFYNFAKNADLSHEGTEIIDERELTIDGITAKQYTGLGDDLYGRLTVFLSRDGKRLYRFSYFAPPEQGPQYVTEYEDMLKTVQIR